MAAFGTEAQRSQVGRIARGLFDRIEPSVNRKSRREAYTVCAYIASQYVDDNPLGPEQFIAAHQVALDARLFSLIQLKILELVDFQVDASVSV